MTRHWLTQRRHFGIEERPSVAQVPCALIKGRLRQSDIAAAILLLLVALLCIGCGTDASHSTHSTSGPLPNHIHDLLALRGFPHTALVATHAGLFRTADGGRTWSEVAGGRGEVMDGLMTYQLTQSPVDPSRLYVLGVPGTPAQTPATTAGVYTSADAGKTWQLATSFAIFGSAAVYSLGAGPSAAGQVYAVLRTATQGSLVTSDDFGRHWRSMSTLPTAEPAAVMPVTSTAHAHRLVLWSALDGIFFTDDDAQSWQRSVAIVQGIDELTVTLRVDPGTFGTNTFTVHVTNPDGSPASNGTVFLVTSMVEMDMGTNTINLTPSTSPGTYSGQGELPMAGHWQLRTVIRTREDPTHLHTTTFTISASY
jgi:hypothetical protein